jgi:hypothetical protein
MTVAASRSRLLYCACVVIQGRALSLAFQAHHQTGPILGLHDPDFLARGGVSAQHARVSHSSGLRADFPPAQKVERRAGFPLAQTVERGPDGLLQQLRAVCTSGPTSCGKWLVRKVTSPLPVADSPRTSTTAGSGAGGDGLEVAFEIPLPLGMTLYELYEQIRRPRR